MNLHDQHEDHMSETPSILKARLSMNDIKCSHSVMKAHLSSVHKKSKIWVYLSRCSSPTSFTKPEYFRRDSILYKNVLMPELVTMNYYCKFIISPYITARRSTGNSRCPVPIQNPIVNSTPLPDDGRIWMTHLR
ncbi:hypothetical protein SK128_006563 [Halocaridina rubra]|uniref:Uncharacterized protein n=1 Tax=Halocaridina rubra TaxID=373956 RepID=A0AAN9A1Z6_HALRR